MTALLTACAARHIVHFSRRGFFFVMHLNQSGSHARNVKIFHVPVFKIKMDRLSLPPSSSSSSLPALAKAQTSSTQSSVSSLPGLTYNQTSSVDHSEVIDSTDSLWYQGEPRRDVTSTMRTRLMAALPFRETSIPELLTPQEIEGLIYLAQSIVAQRAVGVGRIDARLLAEEEIKTPQQANAYIDILIARERVKEKLFVKEKKTMEARVRRKIKKGVKEEQAQLEASRLFKTDSALQELAEKEVVTEKQARRELRNLTDEERDRKIVQLADQIIIEALEFTPFSRVSLWRSGVEACVGNISRKEILNGIVLLKQDEEEQEISIARSDVVSVKINERLSRYPSAQRELMLTIINLSEFFEDEDTLSELKNRKDEEPDSEKREKIERDIKRVEDGIRERAPFKEQALRIKEDAEEEAKEEIPNIEAARKRSKENFEAAGTYSNKKLKGQARTDEDEDAKDEISNTLINKYECTPQTAKRFASLAVVMRRFYSPIEIGLKLTGKIAKITKMTLKEEKGQSGLDEISIASGGDTEGFLADAFLELDGPLKELGFFSNDEAEAGPSNSGANYHRRDLSRISFLSAEDWSFVISGDEEDVRLPMRGPYPDLRRRR